MQGKREFREHLIASKQEKEEKWKKGMKYWKGYGLYIPMSKADSCIHTENEYPDNECYTQMMIKHVFALIEEDVCKNCSSYKDGTDAQ
jgi:hypothetical protein